MLGSLKIRHEKALAGLSPVRAISLYFILRTLFGYLGLDVLLTKSNNSLSGDRVFRHQLSNCSKHRPELTVIF